MERRRIVRRLTSLLLAVGVACSVLAETKPDKQAEGVALLRRAVELTDISGRPYRLRYSITVSDPILGSVQGTKLVIHPFAQMFREEIQLPRYEEVRVFRDGQLYRTRTLPFTPLALRNTPLSRLKHNLDGFKVNKVFDRKIGGVQTRCVEQKRERPDVRMGTFCVYPDSGLPAAIIGADETHFSDYISFAGGLIPRTIQASTARTKTELRLQEFGTILQADDTPFTALAGVTPQPWCEDMKIPVALATPDPEYPAQTRQEQVQSTILYEVAIGTDGRVNNVVPIASDWRFDPKTRNALAGWRFKPATCGGTPVPTDIVVEFNFRLY